MNDLLFRLMANPISEQGTLIPSWHLVIVLYLLGYEIDLYHRYPVVLIIFHDMCVSSSLRFRQ
jgi:hypothetical protein